MVKGTISTPTFYGTIQSIDTWRDLKTGDKIINKESGNIFTVLSISFVHWEHITHISYRIRGNNAVYERSIDFELIKSLYWKIIK